jgi:hypothetical protein
VKWGEAIAYTKIIALKNRLDRAVKYALNEDKTNLENAISYATNPAKNERRLFEGSSGCSKDHAFSQMIATKRQYNKIDGVQGYHIIQSFAPGEVTPEEAFQIAEEFVQHYLASDYEVIWSTHLDREHYHNHIVFNSVSYNSGKKYRSNYQSYYQGIRKTSDDICKRHNLSIIIPGIGNTSLTYLEWLSLNKGKTAWTSIIRSDIDHAISKSFTYGDFLMQMEQLGYDIKQGKHLAFCPYGKERFSRGYKLGNNYSEHAIIARIAGTTIDTMPKPTSFNTYQYNRRYKKGQLPDFMRAYWRWLYMMGLVKKYRAPPRMSRYLKEELLKFEQYKEQFRFLQTHHIETESNLQSYKTDCQNQLTSLNQQLKPLTATLNSRKRVFNALSNTAKYKKARDLFQQGFHQMEEEHQAYQSAINLLADNGYETVDAIQSLCHEKAAIYDKISDIKRHIHSLKQDLKICTQIQSSMEHIQQKTQLIETNQPQEKENKERDTNGRNERK